MMMQLRKRIERIIEKGSIKEQTEKEKIEYLLRTKKWNPYCLRHSAITDDSDYLPEFAVKKKARWSMNSRQGSRYIKTRMGADLKRTILLRNGITVGDDETLKPKPSVHNCPRCNLINIIENKYCFKCSYPLVPEAFDEIKQEEESKIHALMQKHVQELKETTKDKDREIQLLKDDMNAMRDHMKNIFEVLKIAKQNDGRIGKDRTMLDENRRVTFGCVDNNNQIVEVKVPLDGVEIANGGSATE